MDREKILELIRCDRIIAVVRTDSAEVLRDVVEALIVGGVSIIELTLTIPNAIQAISDIQDQFAGRVLLGAGTVLSAEEVRKCIQAGAQFIVTPVIALDVIDQARKMKVPVMAGAYTPSEIFSAQQFGADIVKLFPADNLGPDYLKAVHGPFPNIPIMPTGGVDLQNANEFLNAGAVCLGIGGQLVDAKAIKEGNFKKLTALARQFRSIVPKLNSLSS